MQVALEALDRADQAAEVIKVEGMTCKTEKTGAVHIHPLLKAERESSGLFLRCWTQLHLEWGPIDGRHNGDADYGA